jgi:membrane protein required for colicin V production
VFDRAVAANTVPMIDNSRTAKVVASIQGRIDASIPTDAPGWILTRYNDLTKVCATNATEAPAPAPAPEPAPANP